MKYTREQIEEIYDMVEEIRFFSEQINTKIKTDYFSDGEYDISIELRKINECWGKIDKYLSDEMKNKKVTKTEEHKSINEMIALMMSNQRKYF